ncbi:hypothetical protein ACFOD4_09660 [Pseudoroseomonas globiformis]|uniref:Lipoprotein n=1 Tax=Teichococcus globiformis TaxID=2307229 RepID=A0ABV7FY53_9PROT
MRPSLMLLGGFALMLAACDTTPRGAALPPGSVSPSGAAQGNTAGTGNLQGNQDRATTPDNLPGRAAGGVPTAGTGRINPLQGNDSQPPRPGMGSPTAQSSTISPIQGQDDKGPGAR